MRLPQKITLLWAMLTLTGCRSRLGVTEQPVPPDTVALSQMMRELSTRPGFTEALLAQLDGAKQQRHEKKGPALLTPELIEELRKRIFGNDWAGLDRFPGWTMREINPTVRMAGHVLGKDQALEDMSAVHPGAAAPPLAEKQARLFLDLGPYPLNRAQTIALDTPSTLPGFSAEGILSSLGMGVTRGDGPNGLASEHAESQRLADVLNRLSANRLEGSQPFSITLDGHTARAPEQLMDALLATGHTIAVHDARYFANFGHLHYAKEDGKAQDVMMPFWINTQIAVPGTGSFFGRPRPLLVPVSHAEYEWQVRGPKINADVSHYFGIDGKAEFRTMDTLDQAWVLKRNAHTYTGAQATEVTRLIGLITLAYMHQHAARPTLPFGGYYALGVCQDPVSAIEKKLHGRSTLFPNTADSSLFNDPRDAEVNALMAAIPKDRAGAQPQAERIFGSLPTEPGPQNDFHAITVPGLRQDLQVSYAAWQNNRLQRTHGQLFYVIRDVSVGATVAAVAFLCLARRRRSR